MTPAKWLEADVKAGRGPVSMGEYRIPDKGELGSGGNATVYSATHPRFGRIVLKLTNKGVTVGKRNIHLQDEVDAHRKISAFPECHELICCMLDVFEIPSNGKLYGVLALEKMDGSIPSLLNDAVANRKGTLLQQIALTCHIMLSMMMAVRFIHSRNMTHGDMKPDNCLYKIEDVPNRFTNTRLRIKLSDLGATCESAKLSCFFGCTYFFASKEYAKARDSGTKLSFEGWKNNDLIGCCISMLEMLSVLRILPPIRSWDEKKERYDLNDALGRVRIGVPEVDRLFAAVYLAISTDKCGPDVFVSLALAVKHLLVTVGMPAAYSSPVPVYLPHDSPAPIYLTSPSPKPKRPREIVPLPYFGDEIFAEFKRARPVAR